MKRTLLIVCLLVSSLGRIAHASPFVTSPADWKSDPQRSTTLLDTSATIGHFGHARGGFDAEVFVPAQPGIALFVTHAGARVVEDRDRAARAEVDQFHRASQRAQLVGSGITEDGWQERVDRDKRQIDASLTWRDRDSHTIDISRLVIAGTTDQLVAVTGECIARDDIEVSLIKACTNALATLDPRVDPRVALTLAPTGSEPAATEEDSARPVQPSMQDGSRAVLPPMTIPHEAPQSDRRPVYVGGGILVMVAIFWWNRRRRERFERDDVKAKESDDR